MGWSEVLPLLTVIVVPLVAVMGGAWASQLHNTKQLLAHVGTKFDAQTAAMKAGFEAVDLRFDAVDQRFEDQTATMNARFDAVDRRIGEVRDDLRSLSIRVDGLAAAGAGV